MTSTEKYFIINELNLLPCALRSLLGKETVIVDIKPHLSVLTGPMRKVFHRLAAKRKTRWFDKNISAVRHLTEYPASISMHNIFEETETWLSGQYRFDEFDTWFPRDAMAFKHAVCTYSADMHSQVMYLDQVPGSGRADVVSGTTPMIEGLFESYFGKTLNKPKSKIFRNVGFRAFNAMLGLAVLGMIVVRAFRLIRFSAVKPEEYFMIVDFVDDPDDIDIYHLVSDGGRIAMVLRKGFGIRPENEERISKWPFHDLADGALQPGQAIAAAAQGMRTVFSVMARFGHLEPGLFRRFVIQPYRRIIYRGFFNKHRPKHYWSRDLYSPDHILRRQELNRVGAESHGILHGFGGMTNRIAVFRYLCFDHLYVFGPFIPEKYFQDTWAADMEIVSIGSFKENGIVYEIQRQAREKTNNILISMSFLARLNHPAAVSIVRSLAAEFPHYQVVLQVKSNFLNDPETQRFISDTVTGLDNIVSSSKSVYTLLAEADYVFSDPSTIIMECLQSGRPTFMIDVLEFHRACFYREFPELCVRTADEAISKIRELEIDDRFDATRYGKLIRMEGPHPGQILRSSVGLPPAPAPVQPGTCSSDGQPSISIR